MNGTPTSTIALLNLPQHLHTLNNVVVKLKASTTNGDESSSYGKFLVITNADYGIITASQYIKLHLEKTEILN